MDENIKELVDLLQKQEEIHDELISSATIMGNCIKEKNIAGIQEITSRYDHLTGQVENIEIKRLELCDKIALEKLATVAHLNLKGILNILDDKDDKKVLEDKRNSLKKKIETFSKLNMRNNILIEDRIEDIDSNVKIIADQVNKPAGYGKAGTMSSGKVNKHMLNRIA